MASYIPPEFPNGFALPNVGTRHGLLFQPWQIDPNGSSLAMSKPHSHKANAPSSVFLLENAGSFRHRPFPSPYFTGQRR